MTQEINNYDKEKLTIDLVWANIFSLLILIPIFLIFGVPFYLLWGSEIELQNIREMLQASNTLFIVMIMILGVIMHELIHGISWAIFAKKGFKSMKFGVLWKMLTPYCHCKEPLKVKHYIIGGIMPAIILGIIPAFLSIIIGNFELLLFGVFFTIVAAGDFLIINLIRKENLNDLVQDHPSEAGCYIYRKQK